MKKENTENTDLSRRNFLSKGTAAVVAGASIIVIPATAPTNVSGATQPTRMLTNDPVYTEDVQTLTNKTISSKDNTLGTDYVNIREFPITGVDITDALNSAIESLRDIALGPYIGGRILIPKGIWTSDGGHDLFDCVSIEGVGFNQNDGWGGTEVKLNEGGKPFMFRIRAYGRNISLRNMSINLKEKMSATGVWMTNIGAVGDFIYSTHIENFGIFGGSYGIKVDSASGTQFECLMNRFERVSFGGCKVAFYCNTTNSGFAFDTCHFYVPAPTSTTEEQDDVTNPSGIALYCYRVGNIALDHCTFVGTGAGPNQDVLDGTTLLKTFGMFNNISFYDCQDEGLQYAYRNRTNHWDFVAIVYRNCLIQSLFKITANTRIVMDSCRCSGTISDTLTAGVKLYLKGVWNFYTTPTVHSVPPRTQLVCPYSHVVYERLGAGEPVIKGPGVIGTQTINASRGAVNIGVGASSVQVNNWLMTATTLVFAQLRTHDSGGARITRVESNNGNFIIHLDKSAASELSVGFVLEM